jgi:hypothetical protein
VRLEPGSLTKHVSGWQHVALLLPEPPDEADDEPPTRLLLWLACEVMAPAQLKDQSPLAFGADIWNITQILLQLLHERTGCGARSCLPELLLLL